MPVHFKRLTDSKHAVSSNRGVSCSVMPNFATPWIIVH